MGTASLAVSLVGVLLTIIGFIPLLGWLNWFTLILFGLALIFGLFGLLPSGGRGKALAGIIITIIFGMISAMRLGLGGGLL
jgi:hypothetical protein